MATNKPPHSPPSPASGRGAGGEGTSLLDRAKQLRQHQTDAERHLWYHLRAKRFMGLKFKRQKPIGPYIADFVCFQPALVVEVDGGQHMAQLAYDRRRDDFLRERGFIVLRFWNNEVLNQVDSVLDVMWQAVCALSPSPSPADGRGETDWPLLNVSAASGSSPAIGREEQKEVRDGDT